MSVSSTTLWLLLHPGRCHQIFCPALRIVRSTTKPCSIHPIGLHHDAVQILTFGCGVPTGEMKAQIPILVEGESGGDSGSGADLIRMANEEHKPGCSMALPRAARSYYFLAFGMGYRRSPWTRNQPEHAAGNTCEQVDESVSHRHG
jgi:hypothetical protein